MEAEQLSSSLEDYLEIILFLQQEHAVARAKEIGSHLHVNRSSVTSALQSLAKRGLVNYSPYDFITLTDKGKGMAEDVAARHGVLREFLVKVLRVEGEEANEAACRLEHSLSGTVRDRMMRFLEFVNRCPSGLADWKAKTGFHCTRRDPELQATCQSCRDAASPAPRARGRKKK